MQWLLYTAGFGRWKATLSAEAVVYRGLIICLLAGGSLSGSAQPLTYFELIHDFELWTERSSNPISINGKIYWTSAGYDFGQGQGTHLSFLKITNEGSVQFEDNHTSLQGRYEAGYLVPMGDTGILCLTSFNPQTSGSGDFAHRLTAFDTAGMVLWDKVYPDSGFTNTPEQLLEVPSGYLVIGQKYNGNDGDMVLMKVDGDGDMVWRKEYGGSLYDSGTSFTSVADGGFLLLGWTRSYGSGERDFYLVKTDSHGNEQWFETYGGSPMETGLDIITLSDGNYLLAGAQIHMGKLIKVDGSGSSLWQKEYLHPDADACQINKVIELSSGEMVFTGIANNTPEGNSGWLVKVDSNGDEVWQRKYNKNEYTDLFYNVLETEDGGFLLSGQARDATTLSQDAWLLKVDSIGCPYPNCTVGIDEAEKTVMVDVWPNPCTDVLNIEVIDPYTTLEMTVTDMSGRQFPLSKGVPAGRGISQVNVSAWPSGIYILQGTDEKGRSFSVKVIKQ